MIHSDKIIFKRNITVDHRKTKFGSFLRKFSIDELPQFFNILKGDMSLIDPRPELPHFVDTFKDEIPLYMVKHQVKPGITVLAQVNGYRGDTSIKKRIEYDIYYIENWSIFMEISILFKTVFKGIKNNEKLELKHKEISQDKTIKK
ncbi:putative UDP-glucose:undecaprenyl-phosphate glucose-1-phosphate transferase (fragment) [Clostridium neonatale]|uniref:sugar transferase n=1 Tax=uncultured Clostridium sp. TaxID=59620 RepID=UPI00258F2584